MKLIVDNLDSLTGWFGTNAVIHGLNDHEEYIAGNLDKSLIFKFSQLNGYVEKTLSVDVSDYEELTLHIWSQQKSKQKYESGSDFSYSLDLGNGNVYYLPVFNTFTDIVINISDVSEITKLKITALHGDVDYLLVNYCVVSLEEMPVDVMAGIKAQIEKYMSDYFSNRYPLGVITANSGDDSITFLDMPEYIERYACIKIGSEVHQINSKDGKTFTFTSLYDGEKLLSNYSGAQVYLYMPVEFGRQLNMEILIPSITIWGLVGDPDITPLTQLDHVVDTYKTDGTVKERLEGIYIQYQFLIDAESRSDTVLAFLSKMIRNVLRRHELWVNGRRIYLSQNGTPSEISNFQDITIPKIQYLAHATIKEEIWEKENLVQETTTNQTVTIT